MGQKQLHLHTSNRIERLAQRLVELSASSSSPSALQRETVMTLNPGMARWLSFEIARITGVSFGWEFPLPGKLFARVLAGFSPDFERRGAFDETLARWRLTQILERLEDQPRFALVRSYCQSVTPRRRAAFASRLTRMFDEYLVYRPDVVLNWEDDPQPYDWQAELWRRLVRALYPADRKPPHIARLWAEMGRNGGAISRAAPEHWPERLYLFGVSALAPLYLDLLDKLAERRPVHIFLLQPSDLYWADLKTTKDIQKIAVRAARKRPATAAPKPQDWLFETGNPLLPAFGKQSQMFLDMLIDKDAQQHDDAFSPPPLGTQLEMLQSDLFTLTNRDCTRDDCEPLPPFDGTLQFHSCPSRRREVETLWDYLVWRFDQDADLKSSQILIMAPDIQLFRSHIEAVFEAKRGTSLEISYTIADSAAAARSAPLSGLTAILQAAPTRAGAAEMMALLETPLLREEYRFSDIDLERFEFWIRELGITWGWDAAHRKQHDGFATDRNTWRELQRRLAAGLAFSVPAPLPDGEFAAYAEIEGELADSAGRLLECLSLLVSIRSSYHQIHSLSEWHERFAGWIQTLHCNREDWQQDFQRAHSCAAEALPRIDDLDISGSEAFHAVCEALQSVAGSGGYLSGGVTFCSLKPMRAIPADTICLIGMNRLDFPRRSNRLSFDLLAQSPRIGDRNTREEDRQFFLETLLSVRSHLYISYQGWEATSDAPKQPSAVVEELLAYLRRALPPEAHSNLVAREKRQAHDAAYFEPGSERFTYDPDRAALRNALARAHASGARGDKDGAVEAPPDRHTARAALPLEMDEAIELDLEDLIAFFRDPAKAFAIAVANIRILSDEDALAEIDSLEAGGLDRFQLRQALADAIASGQNLDQLDISSFSQRKLLPPGFSGPAMLSTEVERAAALAAAVGCLDAKARPARLVIGPNQIFGAVNLDQAKGHLYALHGGELNCVRFIDAWIRHLFALCAVPEFSGHSILITLHDKAKHARLGAVTDPQEHLAELLRLYQRGQTAPLPLFPKLSFLCFTAWKKAGGEAEPSAISAALHAARRAMASGLEDSDYSQGFVWSAYDRVCFGEGIALDEDFVQLAIDFWGQIDAALAVCDGNEISGTALC